VTRRGGGAGEGREGGWGGERKGKRREGREGRRNPEREGIEGWEGREGGSDVGKGIDTFGCHNDRKDRGRCPCFASGCWTVLQVGCRGRELDGQAGVSN